jgi:BolA protein
VNERPVRQKVSAVGDRVAAIRQRLEQALAPLELEVRDDSHLHAGHAGARDGRGHFAVRVRAAAFTGEPRLARHRRVNAALVDLFPTDIHALSINALAPGE